MVDLFMGKDRILMLVLKDNLCSGYYFIFLSSCLRYVPTIRYKSETDNSYNIPSIQEQNKLKKPVIKQNEREFFCENAFVLAKYCII